MAYTSKNIKEIIKVIENISTFTGANIDPNEEIYEEALLYLMNTLFPISANEIGYDNSTSGLSSEDLQAAIDELDSLLDILNTNEKLVTYYETVTGASSGNQVSIPTNGIIVLDKFGSSKDAILSTVDGNGNPTWQTPKDASGNLVTTSMATDGTYVFSSTPVDANVAVIYAFKIQQRYWVNVSISNIISEEELNEKVRTNYVLVQSKSDLPTPVSGVITLKDNTIYEINGTIVLGTDRILVGASNVIMGLDKSDDIIVYTGTSNAAITVSNDDFTLRTVTVVASGVGGMCIDMSGDGSNRLQINDCIFANSDEVGIITGGFATIVFNENLITGCSDGLSISGSNGDLFITDCAIESFTGTPTLIDIAGGVTYHTIFISRNMLEISSGQTALNISKDITFDGGGIISINSFEGIGTYLTGINANTPGWRIQPDSNIGIAGLLRIVEANIKSSWSTTSTTMVEITGEDPVFVGEADDYQDNATTFKATMSVQLSHDQSGQDVAFEVYDTDNNVPVGFGSNAKVDVESIVWQSGNIIRYTFNGTPDLSNLNIGDYMTNENANPINNGVFEIVGINDGADWLDVINPARSDSTGDEASGSLGLAWGGSVTYHTITTANVYEQVPTVEFELNPNTQYSVRVRRASSSGGNPAVYIRRGTMRVHNF